ncbi:hypothetical protein CYMTET_41830 [Cymbomonas tetramitiformis]|uniref:Uncharacterized protein n=1 Tax=Cymbomonas tetramitiformis TaxID=36881 RepID=A0AAE0C796_9CHLO|nr:hypothetical protein CYMTET_41830 [Cymbomonas tetramitiformis]
MDDPTLVVNRSVNELVYDTLGYIVEPDSVAYGYLLGTDAVSDLIKGCVPPAVRQKLQAIHSSLTYPAKVDPRPILAKEQRLVRENRAADWTPTATTRDDPILKLFAKIERIESFIKTQRQGVRRTGRAAVLNEGASAGGVNISAYGFAAGDAEDSDGEDTDVEAELQQLRREVTTATEVSMVQASFTRRLSAAGAATAANDAPSYCFSAPTDEFAGGIELVPPPAGRPRTIEMGACSMGALPVDAAEPVVARSSIVGWPKQEFFLKSPKVF